MNTPIISSITIPAASPIALENPESPLEPKPEFEEDIILSRNLKKHFMATIRQIQQK